MDKTLTNEVLIADILIRLKALETLLIAKNIIIQDEFLQETNKLADIISKSILQKANVVDDLDKIINVK